MLDPAQLGHNRSSSPSATLADITERKVPKRFGADAYNAISSGCRTCESVRTSHAILMGTEAPGVFLPYHSVRMQHVINKHIYKKEDNAKNRQKAMHCL